MTTILIAAVLISFIFAPLGCLVLWKRYAYFGDGISHASLLAGSLAIIAGLPLVISVPLVAALFAGLVGLLKNGADNNAVVGLTSSLMLSIAIVISTLVPSRINIDALLFGDIISVTNFDLLILTSILIVSSLFIALQYRNILLIIFSRDIALIQNVKVKSIEFLFLFLLSFTIFATIKIVGALMVVSLLIIPAMTANLFSSTPLHMIISAILISLICNITGIFFSFHLDLPTAPTIVIIGACLYIGAYPFQKI